jgi:hypothetical protein
MRPRQCWLLVNLDEVELLGSVAIRERKAQLGWFLDGAVARSVSVVANSWAFNEANALLVEKPREGHFRGAD